MERTTRAASVVAALAIAAFGCGSTPPPPKPAPPATKKNPPFEAEVSGRKLVVRFADSSSTFDGHAPPRIVLVELDGATLYPRDCAAKTKTKLLACSSGHRAVKHGDDLHMIASHATETHVQVLVAARSASNVECGAHAYWVLRVDKGGFSASEPAVGCFTMPSLDDDARNPLVEWGPPLTLRTFDEASTPFSLVLPQGASVWKVTRLKKP